MNLLDVLLASCFGATPGNTPRRQFDPEGTGYDYESAKQAGISPDDTGHWASRDPKTGLILKGRGHETFHKTIAGEKEAGYEMTKGKDGRYYSKKRSKTLGKRKKKKKR